MSNSIGHGGVTNNPIMSSPYFNGDFEAAQVTPPEGFLLQEDGFFILQEDGSKIIIT